MAEVSFTPDDIVGALHRQSVQLATYLNQPLGEINPAVALDHLVRMHGWLSKLNDIFMQSRQHAGNGGSDERATATKQ